MTDTISRAAVMALIPPEFAGALCPAIAALPAVTVGVKPLVWHCDPDRPEESPAWTSSAIGNQYRIFKAWWGAENKWAYVGEDGFHHTLDAAKAAAQADYEARILAALEPAAPDEATKNRRAYKVGVAVGKASAAVDVPEVQALVEAVERLNAACDAMWNDHARLEPNPDRYGQKWRIKEPHIIAITEAQQQLPATLAPFKGAAK